MAYPPRRMELASFRVQKSVNISQEKTGSRVVQVEKIMDTMYMYM